MPIQLPAPGYQLGMGGGRFGRRLPPPPVMANRRLRPPIEPELPPPQETMPSQDLLPEYLAEARRTIPMPSRLPGPGAGYRVGEERYAPSRLQQALGAAATGWMAGQGGPKAGQETYRQIFEAPYERAMGEFGTEEEMRKRRLESLKPAIEAYEGRENRKELIAARLAAAKEAAADRAEQRDLMRSHYEELERQGRAKLEPEEMVDLGEITGDEKLKGRKVAKSLVQETLNYQAQTNKPPPSKLLTPEEEKQQVRLRAAGRQPGVVVIRTEDEEGNPVTKIVPKEVGGEFPSAPTVASRDKEEARKRIAPFMEDLRKISERIITKPLSYMQRIESGIRGIDAALANDPDYRTYQDMRTALAAAMGTAEQGSRISDFDVKGVYLPMVPDVFRDTKDSAEQKWKLIEGRFKIGIAGRKSKSSGSQNPIIQRNKRTNEIRHSLDGGITWRKGPPAQ